MKLPVLEKYFEGYTVPEKYKNIASCLIRRFDITGSSDGMYICNCLAHDSGSGDGCGTFTGDAVNGEKSAAFLLNVYACNITRPDLQELTDILISGELSPVPAVSGIRSYIYRMRKEKPLECGGKYTEQYIKRCIHNAADAIDEINGWLPEGYTPDYYVPGFVRESYD